MKDSSGEATGLAWVVGWLLVAALACPPGIHARTGHRANANQTLVRAGATRAL